MAYEQLSQEIQDTRLPEIFSEMEKANYPNLSEKNRVFFIDLEGNFKKYEKLTEKQEWWVRKLYSDALGLTEQPQHQKVDVGNLDGLMKMFALAQQNLKYPAIVIKTESGNVSIKVAGSSSKYKGSLQVTDGRPFGDNVWYGSVTPEGVWTVNSRLDAESEAVKTVTRVLKSLSVDPVKVVQKSAHLSGDCCFCRSKLTADKSAAVGFGPVCAKNYGLLEQWKAAKPLTEVFAQVEAA